LGSAPPADGTLSSAAAESERLLGGGFGFGNAAPAPLEFFGGGRGLLDGPMPPRIVAGADGTPDIGAGDVEGRSFLVRPSKTSRSLPSSAI